MKSIKTLSLNTPYMRAAVIAVIASVLLLTGIASIYVIPSRAEGSVIGATGTIVKSFPLCSDGTTKCRPTYNDVNAAGERLEIVERVVKTTYTGNLEGNAYISEHRVRNIDGLYATAVGLGTFTGTLNGLQGSFSFIEIYKADWRNYDPNVPGSLIQEGNMFVIPGSGMGAFGREGGLEGICGGGTFTQSYPVPGMPGAFLGEEDYVFRFGEDCKNFDFNAIMGIVKK